MSETDKEFVERSWTDGTVADLDFERLFALARRGADAADEIEKLRAALRDIADGMGETDLAEVGRYAKHIARAALGGGDE